MAWERLIAPLFHENDLVRQQLVQLQRGNFITKLNEELRRWELNCPIEASLRSLHPRPMKRFGIYLAEDEHGLLVTDMTPGTLASASITGSC